MTIDGTSIAILGQDGSNINPMISEDPRHKYPEEIQNEPINDLFQNYPGIVRNCPDIFWDVFGIWGPNSFRIILQEFMLGEQVAQKLHLHLRFRSVLEFIPGCNAIVGVTCSYPGVRQFFEHALRGNLLRGAYNNSLHIPLAVPTPAPTPPP